MSIKSLLTRRALFFSCPEAQQYQGFRAMHPPNSKGGASLYYRKCVANGDDDQPIYGFQGVTRYPYIFATHVFEVIIIQLHHLLIHAVILSIIFSFTGRNTPATGPTSTTHISVPMPTVPPIANPARVNNASVISLIILNFLWILSEMTRATRSFGPVPASDFITMVIP